MRGRLAIVLLVCLAGACSPSVVIAGPRACADVHSLERCLAMADVAAAEVDRDRGDVTAIEIVPDEPPEGAILGGDWPIRVRVSFRDGLTHEAQMCGGVAIEPACSEEPRLAANSVTMGGYRDVPCTGEPPDGCASPHPSVEPEAATAAEPLAIDEQAITIDHEGLFEVSIGEASLPNGILTEASFRFDDGWPRDVAIAGGAGVLEVRSLEPDGRPFDSYYLHGWRPGVERVEAVLLFEVLWFEPGAELGVRDVVVR